MTHKPLKFLRTGKKWESRFFIDTVTATPSASLVETVAHVPAGEPFVYPVYYLLKSSDRDGFSYLEEIAPEILDGIRHGQGLLMIDMSNEGGAATPEAVAPLHQRLALMGIPPARLIFVTQNTRFEEDYHIWADRNGVEDRFTVDEYHCFLRQMTTFVQDEMMTGGEYQQRLERFLAGEGLREKEFLSLTFTPRPHRLAFMLYLVSKGYIERGLVSFPGLKNWKLNLEGRAEDLIKRLPFPNIAELKTFLPDLAALGALTLDTDPASRVTPIVDIGERWYYDQTYFSLVTESGITTKSSHREARFRRFTEKPFKPMLGFHPFVSVSWAYTLQQIRRYGFKTFSPWIDESYDEIEDDTRRMVAVTAEIDRLMALSHEEKRQLRIKLHDVLLHNYQRFAGPIQAWFESEMERPLIDKWRALACRRRNASA